MTYGCNRVFIGGISGSVTRDQIEAEFSKYGKLTSVWVAQNPPGFAFVEYDDTRGADEAVKTLNGARLFSTNEIRVEHSRQRQGGGPDRRMGGMRNRLGNNGGMGGGFRNQMGGNRGGNMDGGFRNDRQGGYRNNNRNMGMGMSGGGSRYNNNNSAANQDGGNAFSRYENDGGIGRFNPLAMSDRAPRNRYGNNPGNSNQRGGNRFNGPRNYGNNSGGQYGNQAAGNQGGYGGGSGNYRSRSPIDNFSNCY